MDCGGGNGDVNRVVQKSWSVPRTVKDCVTQKPHCSSFRIDTATPTLPPRKANASSPAKDSALRRRFAQLLRGVSWTQYSLRKWCCIQLVYFLLYLMYTLLGGVMFMYIEQDAAAKNERDFEQRCNHVENAALSDLALSCSAAVLERNECLILVAKAMRSLGECYRMPVIMPGLSLYDFRHASLYALTITTTIGYGNMYPLTVAGKICTIIYAIFGIPLFLALITESGKCFQWFFVLIINKILSKIRRRALQTDTSFSNVSALQRKWIPFGLGALLVTLYTALFALVYNWQLPSWSYLDCFYFVFQSISLIGLGDIFPDRAALLLECSLATLFGICLLSMCFYILQDEITSKTHMVPNFQCWRYRVFRFLGCECANVSTTFATGQSPNLTIFPTANVLNWSAHNEAQSIQSLEFFAINADTQTMAQSRHLDDPSVSSIALSSVLLNISDVNLTNAQPQVLLQQDDTSLMTSNYSEKQLIRPFMRTSTVIENT